VRLLLVEDEHRLAIVSPVASAKRVSRWTLRNDRGGA